MNATTLSAQVPGLPALQHLIGEEATFSFPIPVGSSYLSFFVYIRRGGAPGGPVGVRAPYARLAVARDTGRLVEYVELDFAAGRPRQAAPVIGEYPHAAVAGLTYQETLDLRRQLLALTDQMIDSWAAPDPPPALREAARQYAALFERLTEPCLRAVYEALNPQFFAWLQAMRT